MKAYKGFDKNLQCRGLQYEIGGTQEVDKVKLCNQGLHACEAPLDVFRYYAPGEGSRYCEVEMDGVSDERGDDSKRVAKKLTVGAEIGIPGLVKAHVEYVKAHTTMEHTDQKAATAGNSGAATAGNSGAATAGAFGAATAGDSGAATAKGSVSVGKNGCGLVRGNDVKIKGGLGAVLVICEENGDNWDIKEWKAFVVDGTDIRADTWYKLVDGKLVEE
jgi:hypothetical protein